MEKWKKDRSKFDGFEIQTNAYPKDEKLFIPYRVDGVEYHFVDYHDKVECRWVRTPFQTIDDIINILQYIKKRGGKGIEELRILPESFLSDLHHSWDEKTRECIQIISLIVPHYLEKVKICLRRNSMKCVH